MIAKSEDAKFVRSNELIPMYNLILRWPFQSIFKIPIHMSRSSDSKLRAYELLDKSCTVEKEIFYHIKEIRKSDFHSFYLKLDKIVFLLGEVESIEENYPEYKAFRDPVEGEYDFYLSTPENMNIVIPLIFYISRHDRPEYMNFMLCRALLMMAVKDGQIDDIINEYKIDESRVYPPQLEYFATVKPLTLLEKAQKFVAQRPANKKNERLLLLLELERRFPELRREDVGRLLYYNAELKAAEEGIQRESYSRRYYRAQEDAYIYRNLA